MGVRSLALAVDADFGLSDQSLSHLRQLLNFAQEAVFFYLVPLRLGGIAPGALLRSATDTGSATEAGLEPVARSGVVALCSAPLDRPESLQGETFVVSLPDLAFDLGARERLIVLCGVAWRSALRALVRPEACPSADCILSGAWASPVDAIRNAGVVCDDCRDAVADAGLSADSLECVAALFRDLLTANPPSALQYLRRLATDGVVEAVESRRAGISVAQERLEQHAELETPLANWLCQFRSESEVAGALRLAESLWCFGAPHFEDLVEGLTASVQDRHGSVVYVPLGRPGDSAYSILNHATHLVDRQIDVEADLESALLNSTKTIVLLDDCVISGTQFEDVLREYLDICAPRPPHRYVRGLSHDAADRLNGRHLVFAFAIATRTGLAAVEEAARSAGLDASVLCARWFEPTTCFEPGMPCWDSRAQRQAMRHAFFRIGYELVQGLRTAQRGEEWLQRASLGYGDHQLLVSFARNCPTSTVTAFWRRGRILGEVWAPLLPRR